MSLLEKFRNRSFKRNKSNDKPTEPEAEISGRLRGDDERQPTEAAVEDHPDSTRSHPQDHPHRHRRAKSSPVDTRRVRSSTPASWMVHNLGKIFPRCGHTVNVGGAKADEIYLFGGSDGDQLLDDLHRIDPGSIEK